MDDRLASHAGFAPDFEQAFQITDLAASERHQPSYRPPKGLHVNLSDAGKLL
jgi:hypothetical protein